MRFACAVLGLLGCLSFALGCGDDGGSSTTKSPTSAGGGGGAGGAGGGGAGGMGPLTGDPIKIVNWNVRNFFDNVNDPAIDDEFETILNLGDYNVKVASVASVIASLDPDVVVLAEVENDKVLADLNDELGGVYVERSIIDGNDIRGVDVAAMSKIPFDQVVSHADEEFTAIGQTGPQYQFSRDCPEYHLTFNGKQIVLLGVHFRSKGGGTVEDDPNKRLAEAQHARKIADDVVAMYPDAYVAVVGDFNDVPGSNPVEAVRALAPPFTDAPDFLPAADAWTFDYMGALELIDHQMANGAFAARMDTSSVVIPHDVSSNASDHSPISVTYLIAE